MSPRGLRTRQNRRPQRRVRPIIVLGCEGRTERNYVSALAKAHGLSVKLAAESNNKDMLIARVAEVDEFLKQVGTHTIPIIIFDAETSDGSTIKILRKYVNQKTTQHINFFINFPLFERWMLMHFLPVSPHESKATISRKLRHELKSAQFPEYTKPGNVQQFSLLAGRGPIAMKHCTQHGHGPVENACMCGLINLLALDSSE